MVGTGETNEKDNPLSVNIAFVSPNLGGDYSNLDIAITTLATVVNCTRRHHATICDLTFHRRDWQKHLNQHLDRNAPQVVGMSLNGLHMEYARIVGRYIKHHYPHIRLIVGGHHASCHTQELKTEGWVDQVFVGDSEVSLLEYLNTGNYEHGYFLSNLDHLPTPDWSRWPDLDKYFYFLGGMLYVIGSRGCPHQCTFCLAPEIQSTVAGKYFRQRSPSQFAQELAILAAQYGPMGLKFFQVFDPVFTIDPEWVWRFTDEYKKHCSVPYSVFARLDQLDTQRVRQLAESNCKIVRVGIEAGNDHMRNNIFQKNLTLNQIQSTVDLCHHYGLHLTAYYILGGPGETHQSIRETIKLADHLACSRSVFFVFKPFTKAGLQLVADNGGHVIEGQHTDNITFGVAIQPSPELTPTQVLWYQRLAYLLTFGKRWLRRRKHPLQLVTYLRRGLRHGLSLKYLLTYFQVYAGDNVLE